MAEIDFLPEFRVRTVANGYVVEIRPPGDGYQLMPASIFVAKSRAELTRVIARLAMDARMQGQTTK